MGKDELIGVKLKDIIDKKIYEPYIELMITPIGGSVYYDLYTYNKFMMSYDLEHKYCPKCGDDRCLTTFAGFILNADDRESYVDENDCVCQNCGDIHIKHNRINEEMVQRIQQAYKNT